MRLARLLFAAGVAMPVIYFVNLVVAELLTPGFQPASQLPSELGLAGLAWARVFNAGLIAVGVAAALGALGLFVGLCRIGANVILAVLTGVAMSIAGFAMTMAGMFPLPDPLHYGFNVLPAGMLTPLFGALALGAAKDAGGARLVILAGFAFVVSIVVASEVVPGLVVRENVGLWVRGLALLAFTTIAYLCVSVLRRV